MAINTASKFPIVVAVPLDGFFSGEVRVFARGLYHWHIWIVVIHFGAARPATNPLVRNSVTDVHHRRLVCKRGRALKFSNL